MVGTRLRNDRYGTFYQVTATDGSRVFLVAEWDLGDLGEWRQIEEVLTEFSIVNERGAYT